MTVPNFREIPSERLRYITPDGLIFELNNPPEIAVWNITNFGMSSHDISSTKGPFQQGETVLSQRLNTRVVTLELRHNGISRDKFWTHRTTLVDYLRENRSQLTLPTPGQLIRTYMKADGTIVSRALDVVFTAGAVLNLNSNDQWDNYSLQETITFTAFDPLFYDPTPVSHLVITPTEELIFPMTYTFVLGTYAFSDTITYTGTWQTFPTIKITGPAQNVCIINRSTGQRLNLKYAIPAGEVVTFNLDYGFKTVTDSCGNDLIGYIYDSDIGTFCLECAPLITGGINQIEVYLDGYDALSTAIEFVYYLRYRGI